MSDLAWQVPVFVLMAGIAVMLTFWKNDKWLPIAFAGVMVLDSLMFGITLGSYTILPVEKLVSAPLPYVVFPPSSLWGQIISGITLLLLGVWWFVSYRRVLW